MNVGVCTVTLRLPENHGLKGKRHIVKSLAERIRHRFNVSVAEVDGNDSWQTAYLGISCVSNDAQHANEVLSKVVRFIEQSRPEAEILDYELEIIPV